jgi:hypothetical protein
MFDAIEATDWFAIPGYSFYAPELVTPGLRALSDARSSVQAVTALSALDGGALVHGHSGMTHPAAVTAAPILLDIAEHAHPTAGLAAVTLLEEAMRAAPMAGFHTVITDHGPAAVPLCCAIARQVRARRELIASFGRPAKSALATADAHWRLEITGSVAVDEGSTLLAGRLDGALPNTPEPADLYLRGQVVRLASARPEYTDGPDGEAAVTAVGWSAPEHPPTGSALTSACSDRLH